MRKVSVFNSITLDGFFTDRNGDMSCFHRRADDEWNRFTSHNAASGARNSFLFGRTTYEMMRSFWPTAQARQMMPEVSAAMERTEKIVASRTLTDPGWTNARVVHQDLAGEVRRLKETGSADLLIMGSGSLVAQLTKERLIDTYTFVIWPFVLGAGRTMFEGVEGIVDLVKVDEKQFGNGNIVVTYQRG